MHITGIVNSVQSSLASAGRVFEVLDEPEEIRESGTPVRVRGVRDSLEFRGSVLAMFRISRYWRTSV